MAEDLEQNSGKNSHSNAKRNPVQRLWDSRNTISTRLVFFILGASLLTLLVSGGALIFFAYQGGKLEQVSNQDVPRLISAFEFAKEGTALAATLTQLQTSTPRTFNAVLEEVQQVTGAYDRTVEQLPQLEGDTARTTELELVGETLKAHISTMTTIVQRRFQLQGEIEQIRREQETLGRDVRTILGPLIDDQLFFAMTGLRSLEQEGQVARTTDVAEFEIYRYLREIESAVESSAELLNGAFSEPDVDLLIPQLEAFEANHARFDRYSKLLPTSDAVAELLPLTRRLFQLGVGEGGGFAIREEVLRLQQSETNLINTSRELINALYEEGEDMVMLTSDITKEATEEVSAANTFALILLFILNVLCITGAIFITRTYVLKRLVHRVEELANKMFTMAEGNLNVEIPAEGNDEITEMAKALEVFRQNSLEALRLNEVERLNEQLSKTNDQLEQTNVELKTAQNQIVMREKLAAMGELTAGVAHEIKNPLNFVMNFADSSSELLEELFEEIDLPEEKRDKEIIEELRGDLVSNFERIQQHGDRANSIVRDMLAMGRESSEWAPTNVNRLLSEHANLAFHSARAANTEFQMTIVEELDENLPEISAIPPDLGRVFLNMFMNSCHAVEQRRKSESEDYQPTLTVRSQQKDQSIEIQIEDNGTGIERDEIEKIFQPFFTTKPTDEGTGLGLALAADIVRAHGGLVAVDSEVNQFTRMTMTLPIEQRTEPQESSVA